jgi:hypothetical protein
MMVYGCVDPEKKNLTRGNHHFGAWKLKIWANGTTYVIDSHQSGDIKRAMIMNYHPTVR